MEEEQTRQPRRLISTTSMVFRFSLSRFYLCFMIIRASRAYVLSDNKSAPIDLAGEIDFLLIYCNLLKCLKLTNKSNFSFIVNKSNANFR